MQDLNEISKVYSVICFGRDFERPWPLFSFLGRVKIWDSIDGIMCMISVELIVLW